MQRGLAWLGAVACAFVLGWHLGRPDPSGAPARSGGDRKVVRELDELEARLAQSSQWVAIGEELARRHEAVSALACPSAPPAPPRVRRLAPRTGAPPAAIASAEPSARPRALRAPQ